MTDTLRDKLIQKGWVTPFNADTLVRLIEDHYADEPAVPEGREPAAVIAEPSDQELLDIAASTIEPYECSGITADEYEPETECAVEAYGSELIAFARAVLARWGNQPAPPADGEVAELVAWLRANSSGIYRPAARAAELLQRQVLVPVSVSERLPAMVTDGLRVAGDCDEQGRCWAGTRAFVDTRGDRDIDYPPSWELREVCAQDDAWLPAHALPLPEVSE